MLRSVSIELMWPDRPYAERASAAAWELAPFGVRVNAVCPGVIATPMIGGGPEVLDHLASISPSGRVGSPEEVARLVTFLASDASSYISGAEIAIDDALTT